MLGRADPGWRGLAIAEERLNRVKHYGGVPALSIQACLDSAERTSPISTMIGRDKDANREEGTRFRIRDASELYSDSQATRGDE
jgi:predicted NodU family carbamoyl transferase